MFHWLKKHYHWIIVFVMMLQTTVYGGLGNNFISIYIIPITEDLGISRGDFSLAVSIRSVVVFIAMIFSGPIFQKFGIKKPIIGGLIAICLGYTLLSICDTPVTISLASVVIGLGEAFIGATAASRVAKTWFHRHQGSIIGLITACTGLGGGVFSVVLSKIIEINGWRFSRLVSGASVFVTIVLAVLLLREKPADIGLSPYAEGYIPKKKVHHHEDAHWAGYTTQQLLRKPTFYLAIITFLFSGVSLYAAFNIIAPYFQDQGMSASDSAYLNGLMLIFLALFKFACGSLSDKIGAKSVCVICMVFSVISLWMLPIADTVVEATIAVLLYSVSLPMLMVMISLVTYPLFGYLSYNATLGIFQAMPTLGSVIAVPMANAVYDTMGSYIPVFHGAGLLSAIALGMLLLLYVLTQRDQKRFMQQEQAHQ